MRRELYNSRCQVEVSGKSFLVGVGRISLALRMEPGNRSSTIAPSQLLGNAFSSGDFFSTAVFENALRSCKSQPTMVTCDTAQPSQELRKREFAPTSVLTLLLLLTPS
jgi:hypothetical protein